MAIESKVYRTLSTSATLTAIVSSCIYPIQRRQMAITPAVVFRRVFGDRLYGLTGYCTMENAHFAFDIYTTAVHELRTVGSALLGALSSATAYDYKAVVLPSPLDSWDDQTETYVRTYDASLWNQE